MSSRESLKAKIRENKVKSPEELRRVEKAQEKEKKKSVMQRSSLFGDIALELSPRWHKEGRYTVESYNEGGEAMHAKYAESISLMLDGRSDGLSVLPLGVKKGVMMYASYLANLSVDADRSVARKYVSFEVYKRSLKKAVLVDAFLYKKDWKDKKVIAQGLSEILKISEKEVLGLIEQSGSKNEFRNSVLKNYVSEGMCRDITPLLSYFGQQMGLKDVFVQVFSVPSPVEHAVMGFRDDVGNIGFVNWGDVIMTDTKNMKMALKYVEDYWKFISLRYLQAKGESDGKEFIYTHSAAGEVLTSIARGDQRALAERMMHILGNQKALFRDAFDMSLSSRQASVDVTSKNLLGAMVFRATHHNFQWSPGNSIKTVDAVRLGQKLGNENVSVGVSGAYTSLDMKAGMTLNLLLGQIYAKLHKDVEITDKLRYRVAVIAERIMNFSMDDGFIYQEERDTYSTGQRLFYVTDDLQLYVGAQTKHSPIMADIRKPSKDFEGFALAHDLLSTHVGGGFELGSFKGYKVDIDGLVELGTKYLGKATKYGGELRLTGSQTGQDKVSLGVKGGYVDSHDFRLTEEGAIEANVGFEAPVSGHLLRLSGYAFAKDTFGSRKDGRLKDSGVGVRFQVGF